MKIKAREKAVRRRLRRLVVCTAALAIAAFAAPAFGGVPPEPSQPVAAEITADLPNGLTVEMRRGGLATAGQPSPATGATGTGGFDWSDAAAGLGVGLAASGALVFAAAGVHRRRETLTGA